MITELFHFQTYQTAKIGMYYVHSLLYENCVHYDAIYSMAKYQNINLNFHLHQGYISLCRTWRPRQTEHIRNPPPIYQRCLEFVFSLIKIKLDVYYYLNTLIEYNDRCYRITCENYVRETYLALNTIYGNSKYDNNTHVCCICIPL